MANYDNKLGEWFKQVDQQVAGVAHHADSKLRRGLFQRCNGRYHFIEGAAHDHADRQMAIAALRPGGQVLHTAVKAVQGRVGKLEQFLTYRRRRHAAWLTVKQATAKCIFDFLQHSGEGGLRHVQGFSGPVHVDLTPGTWGWLFALGLLTCYMAYICYGQGLKRISLVRAAVTCHLEPVLGTLWVWLFWNESFSASGWLGGALVLSAVFLLTTDKTSE